MQDVSEIYRDETFLSEIINAVPSGIFVTDLEHNILMINQAAAELVGMTPGNCFDRKCHEIFDTPMCRTENCTCNVSIKENAVHHGQTVLRTENREIPIEYASRPLKNYKGEIIGCVEHFVDITDRLEQERTLLKQQEEMLKHQDEAIRHLQDEILELSTPVLDIWEGIVALPLVGTVDSHRARIATERLLEAIERTRAPYVIIDITGVPAVDAEVARHILQTVRAVRLMGSEAIVSGLSPHIARTIAQMDVRMENITVRARMTDALHLAITGIMETRERAARATSHVHSRT
jgi:PAS domain S-box-containing protein